jgi:solute carrier family 25 S-adenosylmethionine transporter 26
MAIKFAAYESMRGLHSRLVGGRKANVQEDFAMGAIAGAAAAASTTPLDVIKTNMMCAAASRPSMFGAAAAVYAQGGPTAFFRGVGTRALSNGINSAVFFCFFEAIRNGMSDMKLKRDQEAASELLTLEADANPLQIQESSDLGI